MIPDLEHLAPARTVPTSTRRLKGMKLFERSVAAFLQRFAATSDV